MRMEKDSNIVGDFQQANISKQKLCRRRAVVVVKWSVWSPSAHTMPVRNPLTPTVFSVKFVLEKNKNKQKEPGVGPFLKKLCTIAAIQSK